MKKLKPRVYVVALVLYLYLEALCYLGLLAGAKIGNIHYDPNLATLSARQRTRLKEFLSRSKLGMPTYVRLDGQLGWIPGGSEANSAGMRDDLEYKTTPGPGIVRVSAFGDSYTFGEDVPLVESWQKQIAAMVPSIEVLNYGVPAYGLDQAYLRYTLVGTDYHPNAVFIGYMAENLARDVNVYRPFYGHQYYDWVLTKPRFQVIKGQLVLLRNPIATATDYEGFLRNDAEVLKELGKTDYFYQRNYNFGNFDLLPSVRLGKMLWGRIVQRLSPPILLPDGSYNVKSEAYDVTVRIFDAFYQKALENGALPIILVFPQRGDYIRSQQGKKRRYAPLLEYFRSKGFRFIDVLNALEPYASRYTDREVFTANHHFSPLASEITAKFIVAQLKKWDLLDPASLIQSALMEHQRFATK